MGKIHASLHSSLVEHKTSTCEEKNEDEERGEMDPLSNWVSVVALLCPSVLDHIDIPSLLLSLSFNSIST